MSAGRLGGVCPFGDEGIQAGGRVLPALPPATGRVSFILSPLQALLLCSPTRDLGAVLLLAPSPLWGFPGPASRGTTTRLGSVMCADPPEPLPAPPSLPSPPHPRPSETALPPLLLTVSPPFPHELHVCHLVLGSCQASSRISSINSPRSCLAAGAYRRDWGAGRLPPPPT